MTAAHAAVGAPLYGGHIAVAQTEWIVVVGIDIVAHDTECYAAPHALGVAHKGVGIAPRAQPHLRREMGLEVGGQPRETLDGKHGRRGGLARGDKDIIAIAYGETQALHIVYRVARHVYLAALNLAEHHAVIAYTGMLSSISTHRHGLHAARTAIVAQRDASQTVEGVGDIGNTKAQIVGTANDAHGSRVVYATLLAVDHHVGKPMHTRRILRLGTHRGGSCHQERHQD